MTERFTLRRWSERKLAAAREASAPPSEAPIVAPVASSVPAQEPAPVVPPPASAVEAPPELPPVESLTFDSDFTAFLQPNVTESLKRQALKKLFANGHFNVMDGLDVYIDDYSVPSPLEPHLVAQLLHARLTLNPPATRVNEAGFVEDVPPAEVAPQEAAALAGDAAPSDTPSMPEVPDAAQGAPSGHA